MAETATIDDALNALYKKYGDDADSRTDYLDFCDRRCEPLEMMGSTASMSRADIEAKATALLMKEATFDDHRFRDIAESLALDILALDKAVLS